MTSRRATVGGLTGAVLATAVALRRRAARRLAGRINGVPPTVHTDDGVELHVETDGPDDAPWTVVFAHGFAARAEMFDPQWTALRGAARLVRYDQRGHGRSGWGGIRSATADRWGRDLGRVIDQVGGSGRVILVGHSMGGMAVLALAGLRPELFASRIAAVALMSTLAAPLTEAGRSTSGRCARIRTALSSVGAWLLWLAAPAVDSLHPFRSRLGRRLLRRRMFAGDPSLSAVRTAADMWARTPTPVMSAYLTGLAAYDERQSGDALRDVPVLVLAGTADATIPARAAKRLAERIDGQVRLVMVEGAGHMVTLSRPAAVNAALQDLLDIVSADADERSTP